MLRLFLLFRVKLSCSKHRIANSCAETSDYDEGGQPVTLNRLQCDEGQLGTGPILIAKNLVRFNYNHTRLIV